MLHTGRSGIEMRELGKGNRCGIKDERKRVEGFG